MNDKVSVLYMLTNGIQQTEDFKLQSNHFAAIVKLVSMVTWTVNYYFGQEQSDGGQPDGPDGFFRVFDTYVTVTPTAAFTLGLDVNNVTNEITNKVLSVSLQGVAVYARYQVTTPVALAVRYERLDDEGLFGGIDQVLQEVTATAEIILRCFPPARRFPTRLVQPAVLPWLAGVSGSSRSSEHRPSRHGLGDRQQDGSLVRTCWMSCSSRYR